MTPHNGQNAKVLALVVILLIFAAAGVTTLVLFVQQRDALCDFQHRSWTIQRQQIVDDAKPERPSEAVMRAFPQLRPFYDPTNPLYAEQIRALNERRDRRLRVLGGRPDC